jgi:arylsulfatase A-like enzyme
MRRSTNGIRSAPRILRATHAVLAKPLAAAVATVSSLTALALADATVACLRQPAAGSPWSVPVTFALGVAMLAWVAPPLALVVFALLRALRAVPSLALPLLLLGMALCVVGALAVVDIERIQWDAVDLWLPTALLGGMALEAGTLVWLVRTGRRVVLRMGGALLVLFVAAIGVFSTASADARSQALAAIDEGSALLSPLVQRASRALDGDGDGHPRWLCGEACDCDDQRGSVHPLARELPDNGVDEDCDGHDSSVRELEALDAALGIGLPEPPGARPGVEPDAQDIVAGAKAAMHARPPDVLLIVVDTLRVDHLGLYGYARATSPRIDALGKDAVVFEQARSAGPSTRFSMPAMLCSKWFTELQRNHFEWPAISEREILLGERLHDLGYTLAAFHSIRYFRPYFHLGQGFDHWSDRALDERTPELLMTSSDFITDEVLAWLDARPAHIAALPERPPLFLWAYYGDPHAEYMRHPGFPSFGPTSIDRYDGEIAFTDHHIGRLLDGLVARKVSDNLIVILTSDHGEALDKAEDHGVLNHSKDLYDELIHVPLLIKGAGFAARRVKTPVSLIDVLPTLLDLAHAPLPEELRGVSLLPWLTHDAMGGAEEPRHPPLFFEKHRAIDDPQKGMLAWPYKVITTVPTGRTQIYAIDSDPHEAHDLYESMVPVERLRLTGMLQHWASQVLRPAHPDYRH